MQGWIEGAKGASAPFKIFLVMLSVLETVYYMYSFITSPYHNHNIIVV